MVNEIIEEINENVKKGEKAIEEIIEESEPKKKKPSLKKAAELESTKEKTSSTNDQSKEESSLEEKKKKILEKAEKLKEKLVEIKTEDLKEKVRAKKKADMLIPLEEYVKSGIYIGTRVVTPNMRPFVYRRRADGLAIFNTDLIDEKIKEGAEFLSKFVPEQIILVCKRQAGWKSAEMFSKITGIRIFTKKYPAGILTNTTLPDFFENELTIIADAWLDKNALRDTLNAKKKVLMFCDTNNYSRGADQAIIGNNKSAKSLGVIFYLLTREYCKLRGITANIPELDWWMEE
ncbi:MAG: hypothetical protein ABIH28_01540 [archaeon]